MKKLKKILPKKSGRAKGRVSVRHKGGRHKRYLRKVDFKRDNFDVTGTVLSIEYAPNRKANVALVAFKNGDKRYILAPSGLKIGSTVVSSDAAPLEVGNTLPLEKIPAGTEIHNIELTPGKGGQIVKSAGGSAVVQGKEEGFVLVKLPSGEIRRIRPECLATIGSVGNASWSSEKIGSAGRKRRMGIRPSVRGVAMHPGEHPHGGGEGRSGVGLKYPKTYKGKKAVGRTRKRRKYSDKYIIKRRKPGKHQKIIKVGQ